MRNKVSQGTYDRINNQLRQLQHELVSVVIPEVAAAREHSNNEENDQLIHAKQQQQNLETRISNLLKFLRSSDVVTEVKFSGKATYGTIVRMENEATGQVKDFRIVGEMESSDSNDVSMKSPMGLAIAGSHVGDLVEIDLPSGSQSWSVLDIRVDPQFL